MRASDSFTELSPRVGSKGVGSADLPSLAAGLSVKALAGVIEQAFRLCIRKGKGRLRLEIVPSVQRTTNLGLADDLT